MFYIDCEPGFRPLTEFSPISVFNTLTTIREAYKGSRSCLPFLWDTKIIASRVNIHTQLHALCDGHQFMLFTVCKEVNNNFFWNKVKVFFGIDKVKIISAMVCSYQKAFLIVEKSSAIGLWNKINGYITWKHTSKTPPDKLFHLLYKSTEHFWPKSESVIPIERRSWHNHRKIVAFCWKSLKCKSETWNFLIFNFKCSQLIICLSDCFLLQLSPA